MATQSSSSAAGDPQSAAELVETVALGRRIESFNVLGPNNLKTLATPEQLAGQKIEAAECQQNYLVLQLSSCCIRADLQRTGALVFELGIEDWAPGATGRPPTARLRFDDGSAIDFVEPAKTKRISFWIEE